MKTPGSLLLVEKGSYTYLTHNNAHQALTFVCWAAVILSLTATVNLLVSISFLAVYLLGPSDCFERTIQNEIVAK